MLLTVGSAEVHHSTRLNSAGAPITVVHLTVIVPRLFTSVGQLVMATCGSGEGSAGAGGT